eukprot:TRINITY_DN43_c0_g6_i3.p4 TRINITY_DN43_c0_g6~~TRINITY_DN43_c0_g6_i3.p4  ORF type:complete len:499 (+),score=-105.15 TRINITY_DN43_c0_g6_i3:8662-10158(+)
MFFINDLKFVQPEIFVSISILILLVVGLSSSAKKGGFQKFSALECVIMSLLVLFFVFMLFDFQPSVEVFLLGTQFSNSQSASYLKICSVLALISVFIFSFSYFKFELVRSFELPVIMISALLGAFFVLSSIDLVLLYLALELQSLASYVLAASKRYSNLSTEAGLRYFILGSLSSAFILLGISIIYGCIGSTNILECAIFFESKWSLLENLTSAGFLFGVVLLISGLLFKLSSAPFHSWVPDVYEGSSTIVTAFFALVPKFSIFGFMFFFIYDFFFQFGAMFWFPVLFTSGVLSLYFGTFGALFQSSIKRFLAYSTISHVGFILLSISEGTNTGAIAAFVYLVVYLFINIVFFGVLIGVRRGYGRKMENLSDLCYLQRSYPLVSVILAVNLFSVAGIPPLAGFFSKYYVLMSLMLFPCLSFFLAVLASVVSCAYYIRFVKCMYFVERRQWEKIIIMPYEIAVMISVATLFNLTFFLFLDEIGLSVAGYNRIFLAIFAG